MIVMAVILFVTVVIPFIVICFWATYTAVKVSNSRSNASHIVRFRFLLYRYRPDVWWWEAVYGVRQLLLAVAPAVSPDNFYAQMIYIVFVLGLYLAVVSAYLPWKCRELNMQELSSTFLFLVLSVSFTLRQGALVWAIIGLLAAVHLSILSMALLSWAMRGRASDFGLLLSQRKQPATLAVEWPAVCACLSSLQREEIETALQSMNVYDLQAIDMAMQAARAHALAPPSNWRSASKARLMLLPPASPSKFAMVEMPDQVDEDFPLTPVRGHVMNVAQPETQDDFACGQRPAGRSGPRTDPSVDANQVAEKALGAPEGECVLNVAPLEVAAHSTCEERLADCLADSSSDMEVAAGEADRPRTK